MMVPIYFSFKLQKFSVIYFSLYPILMGSHFIVSSNNIKKLHIVLRFSIRLKLTVCTLRAYNNSLIFYSRIFKSSFFFSFQILYLRGLVFSVVYQVNIIFFPQILSCPNIIYTTPFVVFFPFVFSKLLKLLFFNRLFF